MNKITIKNSTFKAKYHPGDRLVLRGDPDPSCCHEGCDHCQQCQDTEFTVSYVDDSRTTGIAVHILPTGCNIIDDIDQRLVFTVEDLEIWRKGPIIRATRASRKNVRQSALKKPAIRSTHEATAGEVLACFKNTNRISLMGLRRMLGFYATGKVPLTGKATRELMRLGKIRHDNAYSTTNKGVLVAHQLVR